MDKFTDNKSIEDVEDLVTIQLKNLLNFQFWKNITFSPPLYSADMVGSLFDENVPWNLRELDTVLKLNYFPHLLYLII